MTADELALLKRIAEWLGSAGMIGALWLAWRVWRLVDTRVAAAVQAAVAEHIAGCTASDRDCESQIREEMRSIRALQEESKRERETLWRRLDEQRDQFAEHQLYAARTYITQTHLEKLARDAEVIREQVAEVARRRR
jgi:hypothetical protein